jgi:hypothetical protein
MKYPSVPGLRATLLLLCGLFLLTTSAMAGGVTIASPQVRSTISGPVQILASATENVPFHIEVWDNGVKMGDFFTTQLNTSSTLPMGWHTTTVLAVSNNGQVLDWTSVGYSVTNSQPSGSVNIANPTPGSTSISAVRITASAGNAAQLAMWDNGYKLGEVPGGSVDGVYVLPNGPHVLTVQALDIQGSVISTSNVTYDVVENCTNSRTMQCDLDQLPIDNSQNDCNPQPELLWVANPCGGGVQGVNPTSPLSTQIQPVYEGGVLQNQGNLTLNGRSVHFAEVQGNRPSNVLFRGQSPSSTPQGAVDSHWTLDEYVYLPDPTAHQAFEMDAQYTANGVWTKFYTECAFNINNGTGFWGVFDDATGGWIFLDGKVHNGQQTPYVPCDRKQFSQPWAGSSNPSLTGWHHIAWTFLRNADGTVTFENLVFDATTTSVNFHPNSGTGGNVSDSGNFSALIQLDGVVNTDRNHDFVDAYVSEINLRHTP